MRRSFDTPGVAEALEAAGLSPEEARAAAVRLRGEAEVGEIARAELIRAVFALACPTVATRGHLP